MTKKIFLSHATKDSALADSLVDLLQTGTDISHGDIFCSSLEGLGIAPGKNFIEWIKSELQEPDVVIVLLTPNYLASNFCLCELGATWAMSHKLLPLIVPPLTIKELDGVLSVTQISNIDTESGLTEFATEIKNYLGDSYINIARWNMKSKRFLKDLPNILSTIELPNIVKLDDYRKTQELNEACNEALEQLDLENEKLKQIIKDLKKCKDADDIHIVEKKYSTDYEKFKVYTTSLKSVLKTLPTVVALIAFKQYISSNPVAINAYEERDLLKAAEEATDKEFLIYDDPGFLLNDQHPKIKRVSDALNQLASFLNREADPELFENFEKDNDYPLSINNRDFWHDYIDERMSRM